MRKIYTLIALSLLSLQAFSQEIPEYCLENDVVHRYLTEVQYDPNDYSYSKIRDYCYDYPWDWEGEGKGVRLDFPKPVTLKLTSALPAAGKLYVGETEDYSDVDLLVMNVSQGADSINVFNLIPGRIYNWKLEYNDGGVMTVAQSGRFKTTGQLRMLKIDNVFNVRDMGGWPAMNGYPMKYGKIVRGSRLNVNKSTTLMITDAGIKELRRVGMRSELDMRDASNSVNATHAFFGDDCPILNVNSAYNSRIATFANGPQSIQGINQLIAWLKADKPVYLHCSVGADRTGTVAYLVGALCGMSEDALSKEFELTSFSGDKIDNEADRGTYERLVRQRDYTGRLDKNDNNNSYKFADMVDKIKKNYPGETIQEKVYYHLKTGVNGTKVPEADLDWLINYLVGPIQLNTATSLNLKKGETSQMDVEIVNFKPENPNPVITFTSSDERVAAVSQTGLITAKGGGTAKITAELDGFKTIVTVTVPLVESVVPDSVVFGNDHYGVVKNSNSVINGSFEYANNYQGWTSGTGGSLSNNYFDIVYDSQADEQYLQSKADGDSLSAKSIHMQWGIISGYTYVLGFRIKNTSGQKVESNPNIVVSLVKSKPEVTGIGDDFSWDNAPEAPSRVDSRADATLVGENLIFNVHPSYDGQWTEVQYVFKNEESYKYCQIYFTHLSQNGDNVCLDNLYFAELKYSYTGVDNILKPASEDGAMYNLRGQKVDRPEGIIIINGKKYLYK